MNKYIPILKLILFIEIMIWSIMVVTSINRLYKKVEELESELYKIKLDYKFLELYNQELEY